MPTVDDAARRLTERKQAGIDTILDPTALGLGRYIPRIATLASRIELRRRALGRGAGERCLSG